MKTLLFTTYDLNLNGAALSLANFLNHLDFERYDATVLVLKEHEKEIIDKIPKKVKIIYLYKENPYFDALFYKTWHSLYQGIWQDKD